MNYKIISSCSSGNATIIRDIILIDCGVTFKRLEKYYKKLKIVFLTHIHSDHFKKDKEGQVVVNKSGIPELDDKDVANKMYEEINDLLSLEVEVGRFYIDESTFDYDDSKYDVLTPKDMFALMDFLCRKDEDKTE